MNNLFAFDYTHLTNELIQNKYYGRSFPWILDVLKLNQATSVLDIGSGGFLGESTLKFILNRYSGPITAIEIIHDRVYKLQKKFTNDNLTVIQSDAFDFDYSLKYGLIAVDFDSFIIPRFMNELLPKLSMSLLPGGVLIGVTIYDHDLCFNSISPALSLSYADMQQDFMMKTYLSKRVTLDSCDKFLVSKGIALKTIGIVDAQFGAGKLGVGWLILKKIN